MNDETPLFINKTCNILHRIIYCFFIPQSVGMTFLSCSHLLIHVCNKIIVVIRCIDKI